MQPCSIRKVSEILKIVWQFITTSNIARLFLWSVFIFQSNLENFDAFFLSWEEFKKFYRSRNRALAFAALHENNFHFLIIVE